MNLENIDFHNNDLNNKNNCFELNFAKTNYDLSDEEKNESIENKISKKTRIICCESSNINENSKNKEIDDEIYCYSPPSNIHVFENNTKNDSKLTNILNYNITLNDEFSLTETNNTSNTSNISNISDNKIIKLNIEKFNNKINVLKNLNIQKSVHWCNKYNFTINKNFND